jgi:integrase
VLALGWTQLDGGMLSVRQRKTGKELWIPIHRDLATVLSGIPRRRGTICTNSRGERWTPDGFRVAWSDDLSRPELRLIKENGLVFHGLRKSAVVLLLAAGATEAEVQSITGQSREMVAHYSRQLNQRRLAVSAILKWEADDLSAQSENESLQNSRNVFAKSGGENKSDSTEMAEFEGEFGAGEGNRTLDTQLGKLMFCH